MIDLNKDQEFDPPIELEVSNDNKAWELREVKTICHERFWRPFIPKGAVSTDAKQCFRYARHPQPKHIDTTKAQVFDPPVKMLVSDDPDFPENARHIDDVYCIYPKLTYPIRTIHQKETTSYKYAKSLAVELDTDDTFDKMFKKAFDKAWKENITDLCENVAKKILEEME